MSTYGLPYVVVTFIGSSIFEEILKQTVCTVTKLFFILILVSITLIIRFSLILIVFGLILGILAISIRIFSKSYGNCFFFIGITICNFDGNVYFFTWLIVLQTATSSSMLRTLLPSNSVMIDFALIPALSAAPPSVTSETRTPSGTP